LKPLLGRTRSRGRCWAAIRLSHLPEPSGHTVHGEVDGLDIEGQHGRRFVLLRHTKQAAEEAVPHLYIEERKRPTPVRRRLSRTQAILGRVALGGWVLVSGMKLWSLVGLSARPEFQWWSTHCATSMLLLSDELMSCCAVGTNGCCDLRRRAFALNGRVSAEWSRCPGSMARHARDSLASLQRRSADWMPTSIGRLSADVGRRHPDTIRKASLMAGSWGRCEHCSTRQARSTLQLNRPGLEWVFTERLQKHPNQNQ